MKSIFKMCLLFLGMSPEITIANNHYHFTIKPNSQLSKDNSLSLIVYSGDYLPNLVKAIPSFTSSSEQKNGEYVYSFDYKDSIFVFLIADARRSVILSPLIAEAGDSVVIDLSGPDPSFNGKGSRKYEYLETLKKRALKANNILYEKNLLQIQKLKQQGDEGYLKIQQILFSQSDKIQTLLLSLVEKRDSGISSQALGLIMAELIGQFRKEAVSGAYFYYLNSNIKGSVSHYAKSIKFLENGMNVHLGASQTLLSRSPTFVEMKFSELNFECYLRNYSKSYFELVEERFDGMMKDKLLTDKLLSNYQGQKNLDSLLFVVIPKVVYTPYRKMLFELSTSLKDGSLMYDFKLPDEDGKYVSLSDFKGKLVYVHFWFKGCIPCAQLYEKSLSIAERKFMNSPNIVFVSISLDKDRNRWINAINENKYTSKSSINLYTEGKGFDHIVCKKYFVSSAPSPFLIDERGKLITANIFQLGGGSTPKSEVLSSLISEHLKGLGK